MRQTLHTALATQADMNVCGEAATGEAALDAVTAAVPDLVLIDVSLPEMNGFELVARLHERNPGLACVMLSGHREQHHVRRTLAAGARGYIGSAHGTEKIVR